MRISDGDSGGGGGGGDRGGGCGGGRGAVNNFPKSITATTKAKNLKKG